MSFRNQSWLAAAVIALMICIACGQIYRPVVIPVSNIPPTPGNFHAVFSLNTNAYQGLALVYGPGSAMQIDVSGDSDLGVASLVNGTISGANPTHGISLPNNSRVFIATAGSALANGVDTLSSFFPASSSTTSSGITSTNVISFPNYVPNSGGADFFCPYLPDFVAASQNATVYVANYGAENLLTQSPACNVNSTDSVAAFNTSTGALSNLVYLKAGSHPVAMAQVQTPSGNKLYVANQGTSTVASFNTVDMTQNPNVGGFLGTTPVWMVARGDGQQLYVVSQGDGQLWTVNTTNDTVISNVSVGAGANYILYDPNLGRLYVTNATTGAVYVFDATTGPPTLLTTIAVAAPPISSTTSLTTHCEAYTCTYTAVAASSVAALLDGSRFYVASYVVGTATCLKANTCYDSTNVPPPTCPDTTVTAAGCIIPQISVYDALSFAPKTDVFPLFPAVGGVQSFAVAPNSLCAPVVPYTPSAVRFRMSAAAAVDSSRVYSSVCDAGLVAIVNTTDSNTNNPGSSVPSDTLVLDLPTPFGTGTTSNASPKQNPVFLLTGR